MKQALLVIDAQQELIEGNEEEKSVFNKTKLLDHINSVIKKALEADSSVIFVRDKDVADGKGKGFEVHQEIEVPSASKVLTKKLRIRFMECR